MLTLLRLGFPCCIAKTQNCPVFQDYGPFPGFLVPQEPFSLPLTPLLWGP